MSLDTLADACCISEKLYLEEKPRFDKWDARLNVDPPKSEPIGIRGISGVVQPKKTIRAQLKLKKRIE